MLRDLLRNIFGESDLPKKKLSDIDIEILDSKVFYFNQLSAFYQELFATEVAFFLEHVPIYFKKTKKSRHIELLVASSAVIVTFGHSFRYKSTLSSVVIVKEAVTRLPNGGFTSGEVRYKGSFVEMYLSESALINGFDNHNDKHNVGIHEFVHVLDIADGYMDGIPSLFMPLDLIEKWKELAVDEMKKIDASDSTIRDYGAVNDKEFLTVCSEYFFERPKKLEREHPKVYELLSDTFQQDPLKSYNFKRKERFAKKKEIGRNDLCHCGSGKKYKKCHLK